MTRHKPSKPAYKLLGGEVTTEITFELPAHPLREHRRHACWAARIDVVGLTACTPRRRRHHRGDAGVLLAGAGSRFIKPFFMALGPTFLADDRRMVELQREGLKFNPRLLLIQDSDVPAMWYHRLKKAWAESLATGTPFVNPVQKRTLRWRS